MTFTQVRKTAENYNNDENSLIDECVFIANKQNK